MPERYGLDDCSFPQKCSGMMWLQSKWKTAFPWRPASLYPGIYYTRALRWTHRGFRSHTDRMPGRPLPTQHTRQHLLPLPAYVLPPVSSHKSSVHDVNHLTPWYGCKGTAAVYSDFPPAFSTESGQFPFCLLTVQPSLLQHFYQVLPAP